MKQHLAVSAIGSDRTGMVHELTRVISESGGNISESRMANLGTEFAMLLLVSGNWHALAKLETELKRLKGHLSNRFDAADSLLRDLRRKRWL